MIERGNTTNLFKDFKIGSQTDWNETNTEEDWKQKFRKQVNHRIQTALSWDDYRAVMLRGRGI